MTRRHLRGGYGLIDLLVTIGVIGLLVGLALPAVQASREAAMRLACQNKLHQIGTGLHNFHAEHGRFPPAGPGRAQPSNRRTADGMLSWMVHILPQMEQGHLWQTSLDAFSITPRVRETPPHVGYAQPISAYVCPADSRLLATLTDPQGRPAAYGSYVGVAGTNLGPATIRSSAGLSPAAGVFSQTPGTKITDITDGSSQTIAVAERPPPTSLEAGLWYTGHFHKLWEGPSTRMYYGHTWQVQDPCAAVDTQYGPGRLSNTCDRGHFWSLHRGGANFTFADGSVRFLAYSARSAMPALASRAGGEAATVE